MSYEFPPDLSQIVREQMAAGNFGSEDDLLREALRVFRECKARQEKLAADVQAGLAEADRGMAQPLDLQALIERCTRVLESEGIVD